MTARKRSKKKSEGNIWVSVIVGILLIGAIVAAAMIVRGGGTPSSEAVAQGAKIVLDAGHGGIDGGTVGPNTGVKEGTINIEITKRLEALLTSAGFEVIMTRTGDEALGSAKNEDMRKRREIIENSGQIATISIHQNRFEKPSACGPQVFYAPGSAEGERLADYVQQSLNKALEIQKPRVHHEGNYYIVKSGKVPAIIVECGFLSNPEEEKLLQQKDYQVKLVTAIADGLFAYLEASGESPSKAS